MIQGIGCDIVEIARLNETLIHKILSAPEIELYQSFSSEKRKQEFLAGRFALKEAIIKAFGIVPMPEMIILNDESGKPVLTGERFENVKIHLTLAHEKAYAVGFCVIETAGL